MSAQTPYISPSELWRLARPGSCAPAEFEPGSVSMGSPQKTGSGSLLISGYPIDSWTARVRVAVPGEPGSGASVQVSLDGGLTFGPVIALGAAAVPVDVPWTGLTITATAGVAPSFVSGDLFPFSTVGSPEMFLACEAASRELDEYLKDTYSTPLKSWDASLKRRVAILARQILMTNRGLTEALEQFRKSYEDTLDWLGKVARGEIQLGVVEGDGAVVFPDFIKPRPKYATD